MIRSEKSFESPILNFEMLDKLVPVRAQDPHAPVDSRYTLHLSSASADLALYVRSRLLPGTTRRSRFSLFFLPEETAEAQPSDILPCQQLNSKRGVPSGSESTRLDKSVECRSRV